MTVVIPGSEYLGKILHVISQSFLLPVILALIIIVALAFAELGAFAAESRVRKRSRPADLLVMLRNMGKIHSWQLQNLQKVITESSLPSGQKQMLLRMIANADLDSETKRLLAREALDSLEFQGMKTLEKTDLIAKLGPVLGLMGTLIPLGPGLAALGQGNLTSLAQAVIVAFDTTVVGIAAGGIAYLISKVRRRWYEKDLTDLEAILEIILGGEGDAAQESKTVAAGGRRS
ncbi:MotA/TolQ/ExbB proton channel family protein [Thermincola potens]|uniref:MotA/TolQ/ExbB proton channel family protein n=1 Tax=Thermincola potens TaxID=863643 RepID=UPI001F612EA7|nr:MotA/TolQ/ExbB proton channel family protein [Thermincola potens]